ncbi:hypothetical protein CALCODRAFT_181537 [Calocera cornea HHB12733]|uniref:Uncharacterized protein n=1 Tax=Calocera cornea HHB12733 TaxID=1353952 RepID=A0A165HRK8_9BASI|nr:hypothetical protein CALCODRAFT_181537 [Calocera cornea HHB12733]
MGCDGTSSASVTLSTIPRVVYAHGCGHVSVVLKARRVSVQAPPPPLLSLPHSSCTWLAMAALLLIGCAEAHTSTSTAHVLCFDMCPLVAVALAACVDVLYALPALPLAPTWPVVRHPSRSPPSSLSSRTESLL